MLRLQDMTGEEAKAYIDMDQGDQGSKSRQGLERAEREREEDDASDIDISKWLHDSAMAEEEHAKKLRDIVEAQKVELRELQAHLQNMCISSTTGNTQQGSVQNLSDSRSSCKERGKTTVAFKGIAELESLTSSEEEDEENEPIARRTRSRKGRNESGIYVTRQKNKDLTPREIVEEKEGGYFAGMYCDNLAGWSETVGPSVPWPREGSFLPQCRETARLFIFEGYGDDQWNYPYMEECYKVWDKYVIGKLVQKGQYPLRYKSQNAPPTYVPWGHTDKENLKKKLPPPREREEVNG